MCSQKRKTEKPASGGLFLHFLVLGPPVLGSGYLEYGQPVRPPLSRLPALLPVKGPQL